LATASRRELKRQNPKRRSSVQWGGGVKKKRRSIAGNENGKGRKCGERGGPNTKQRVLKRGGGACRKCA